jgi:hypothetical protein
MIGRDGPEKSNATKIFFIGCTGEIDEDLVAGCKFSFGVATECVTLAAIITSFPRDKLPGWLF